MEDAVALPLKGNEFQANHNKKEGWLVGNFAVALPLKGNEFQANHNVIAHGRHAHGAVALPLKGNEFQANHNTDAFGAETTALLLYLSKVTNFKQITTHIHDGGERFCCCFTSQR